MAYLVPSFNWGVALPLAVLASFILWNRYRWHRRNPAGLPPPPGPKGLPLIGNVLDMPKQATWITFREWGRKYGDIVSVNVFGQSVVVINSTKMANEIFEKRSSNYSDRPRMTLVKELMGFDFSFTVMEYGADWKNHRRVFHQYFNPNSVTQFRPIQLRYARAMLKKLLDNPHNLYKESGFTNAAIILDVTYGKTVTDPHDILIHRAETVIEKVALASVPGAFLVDFIPILKYVPAWVPGAGFQKWASQGKEMVENMIKLPFEAVKDELSKGVARLSFTSSLLEDLPSDEQEKKEAERVAMNCAGITYAAGNDSTAAALRGCFLALALFPEFQRKVQQELDEVVGPHRLPEYADRDSLPYLNALFKEVVRWIGIAPVGNPHATTSDDVYNGYFIPAGTIVLGNSWAMQHDPVDYPDPDTFKPDRFLKDGKLDPNVKDPVVAFGFGRRICPGRYFSDNTMFAVVATTLHTFNIAPTLDESGTPIPLRMELYDAGFFIYPKEYQVSLTPRSADAEQLIHDAQEWK